MISCAADARRAAIEILRRVLTEKRPLDATLAQSAESGLMTGLTQKDRALARAIAATALRRKGQIDDLIEEINKRTDRDERVLVTTLTKKMSEDLTDYLLELGIRVRYLHSEVDTIERIEILRDLRLGEFDVLVGINLLREGLDMP